MEILYTKQAEKQISKLDKTTKKRIKDGIEKIPMGDIIRLQGVEPIMFRLRIGDYRVIFEMTTKRVIIRHVLPRGKAYNRV